MPDARTPDSGLDHAALLYHDPEQLRLVVGRFADEACSAQEPMLAVLPAASAEVLDDVLARSGVALTRLSAEDAGRNPGRLIPAVVDWLAELAPRSGRARIISEPMWPGRGDAETAECLRHEAILNVVLADEPVSFVCPYDAEHLSGDVIAGASMTHPRLVDERGVRPSELYGDPLDLAKGEHWPQADPSPPVRELFFDGDLWALRHALAADQLLADLSAQRREDLVFAVNEAASNALLHGDGTCRARVWREDGRVVSEIVTGSEIDDPLAGRLRPDPAATSGRGLWLINQMCDLVEVRSGPTGASVRMHVAV